MFKVFSRFILICTLTLSCLIQLIGAYYRMNVCFMKKVPFEVKNQRVHKILHTEIDMAWFDWLLFRQILEGKSNVEWRDKVFMGK